MLKAGSRVNWVCQDTPPRALCSWCSTEGYEHGTAGLSALWSQHRLVQPSHFPPSVVGWGEKVLVGIEYLAASRCLTYA